MKKWMPVIFAGILMAVLLAGCNVQEKVMTTKNYNLSGFTKVDTSGAFDVEIVQSDSFGVSVDADDFVNIVVERIDDTLVIKREGISWFMWNHAQPKARVAMPAIVDVFISGASKGTIKNFSSANNFAVSVEGASHFTVTDLSAANLLAEVTGASTLKGDIKVSGDAKFATTGASTLNLNGTANNIILSATGASKAELSNFPAQNGDIEISGASNGSVNLSGKMNAHITGASNLYWSGTPVMGDIQTSGASNLRRK
jgi:hypothetical protein